MAPITAPKDEWDNDPIKETVQSFPKRFKVAASLSDSLRQRSASSLKDLMAAAGGGGVGGSRSNTPLSLDSRLPDLYDTAKPQRCSTPTTIEEDLSLATETPPEKTARLDGTIAPVLAKSIPECQSVGDGAMKPMDKNDDDDDQEQLCEQPLPRPPRRQQYVDVLATNSNRSDNNVGDQDSDDNNHDYTRHVSHRQGSDLELGSERSMPESILRNSSRFGGGGRFDRRWSPSGGSSNVGSGLDANSAHSLTQSQGSVVTFADGNRSVTCDAIVPLKPITKRVSFGPELDESNQSRISRTSSSSRRRRRSYSGYLNDDSNGSSVLSSLDESYKDDEEGICGDFVCIVWSCIAFFLIVAVASVVSAVFLTNSTDDAIETGQNVSQALTWEQQYVQFMVDLSTDKNSIQEVGTPQHKARLWLTTVDRWYQNTTIETTNDDNNDNNSMNGTAVVLSRELIQQRFALAVVSFAFLGNADDVLDPSKHECEWTVGVLCNPSDQQVDELYISNNSTIGAMIPPEIGLLHRLGE